MPRPRDDHSLSTKGSAAYLFGGFISGSRANDLWSAIYDDKNNGVQWNVLSQLDDKGLPRRNSHSTVIHGESLFVFGGQDDDSNKLDDLWEYNLNTKKWQKI